MQFTYPWRLVWPCHCLIFVGQGTVTHLTPLSLLTVTDRLAIGRWVALDITNSCKVVGRRLLRTNCPGSGRADTTVPVIANTQQQLIPPIQKCCLDIYTPADISIWMN